MVFPGGNCGCICVCIYVIRSVIRTEDVRLSLNYAKTLKVPIAARMRRGSPSLMMPVSTSECPDLGTHCRPRMQEAVNCYHGMAFS